MPDAPHALTEADLSRAAALSALIGWNQTPADWAHFLHHGAVQALGPAAGVLPATAAFIRYGGDVAWISMVLVHPDRRRQGLATGLMRSAMGCLAGTGCVALDASPAGRDVYRRLGFREFLGFRRWALPDALPVDPAIAIRPLRAADWPAVLALDAAGFGPAREFLLRDFAARLPRAALVAEGPSGLVGYALARDGLRSPQIGPVMARDAATGAALVGAALAALPRPAAGPRAVIDLLDAQGSMVAWLRAHGATEQRPFTRMALGAMAPGDAAVCIAVAGPEFG